MMPARSYAYAERSATRGFASGALAGAPAGSADMYMSVDADPDLSFVSPRVNRKDSNLDSLMYDAAMKKAREKLNVGY